MTLQDEIEDVAGRLERWSRWMPTAASDLQDAAALLRRLGAREESLVVDAERYRFLRNNCDPDSHPYVAAESQNSWGRAFTEHLFEHEADGAVDKARAALDEAGTP